MAIKTNFYALIFLLFSTTLAAENPALLPLPQRLVWSKSVFKFNQNVKIIGSENSAAIADSIQNFFKNRNSKIVQNAQSQIVISLAQTLPNVLNEQESYELTVSQNEIRLTATTETGLFYGFQTLKQLAIKNGIQGCVITDFPAFAVRGFMHDVGRSFISLTELKRQIALLSQYKINTFHWHLTENIAWRLESKVFPKLNTPSVFTRFEGQFYTQAEARDLVDFCKKHHVLLIPEMDMPGHSEAFKRATGFDMQTPEGKTLVKELLREWCGVFDVPFIHLGTDEVAYKDPNFLPEMSQIVRECGKEIIGWQPGGKLDNKAIRQMWTDKPKPQKGIRCIDSRNYYLNHFDAMADLVGVFNHNICDTSVGDADRLGAIACIWNDRKLSTEGDIVLTNGFYPIMLTLAERAWRGGGQLEKDIGVKMQADFAEFENRLLAHKQLNFNNLPFPYVQQSGIEWRLIEPFKNGGDLSKSFPPEQGNLNFLTHAAKGASVYLRHVWGEGVPAYLPQPQDSSTAYAYTYVYSPKNQSVGLWFATHNYGRSEKDATPQLGKWDYKNSRIWINQREIEPPRWKNAGFAPPNHESPLVDEPCEMRAPTTVSLKRGWNFVLIKLPVGKFSTPDTRLVKWFFTAVFVRQNGQNTEGVSGLIYRSEPRH